MQSRPVSLKVRKQQLKQQLIPPFVVDIRDPEAAFKMMNNVEQRQQVLASFQNNVIAPYAAKLSEQGGTDAVLAKFEAELTALVKQEKSLELEEKRNPTPERIKYQTVLRLLNNGIKGADGRVMPGTGPKSSSYPSLFHKGVVLDNNTRELLKFLSPYTPRDYLAFQYLSISDPNRLFQDPSLNNPTTPELRQARQERLTATYHDFLFKLAFDIRREYVEPKEVADEKYTANNADDCACAKGTMGKLLLSNIDVLPKPPEMPVDDIDVQIQLWIVNEFAKLPLAKKRAIASCLYNKAILATEDTEQNKTVFDQWIKNLESSRFEITDYVKRQLNKPELNRIINERQAVLVDLLTVEIENLQMQREDAVPSAKVIQGIFAKHVEGLVTQSVDEIATELNRLASFQLKNLLVDLHSAIYFLTNETHRVQTIARYSVVQPAAKDKIAEVTEKIAAILDAITEINKKINKDSVTDEAKEFAQDVNITLSAVSANQQLLSTAKNIKQKLEQDVMRGVERFYQLKDNYDSAQVIQDILIAQDSPFPFKAQEWANNFIRVALERDYDAQKSVLSDRFFDDSRELRRLTEYLRDPRVVLTDVERTTKSETEKTALIESRFFAVSTAILYGIQNKSQAERDQVIKLLKSVKFFSPSLKNVRFHLDFDGTLTPTLGGEIINTALWWSLAAPPSLTPISSRKYETAELYPANQILDNLRKQSESDPSVLKKLLPSPKTIAALKAILAQGADVVINSKNRREWIEAVLLYSGLTREEVGKIRIYDLPSLLDTASNGYRKQVGINKSETEAKKITAIADDDHAECANMIDGIQAAHRDQADQLSTRYFIRTGENIDLEDLSQEVGLQLIYQATNIEHRCDDYGSLEATKLRLAPRQAVPTSAPQPAVSMLGGANSPASKQSARGGCSGFFQPRGSYSQFGVQQSSSQQPPNRDFCSFQPGGSYSQFGAQQSSSQQPPNRDFCSFQPRGSYSQFEVQPPQQQPASGSSSGLFSLSSGANNQQPQASLNSMNSSVDNITTGAYNRFGKPRPK